MPSSEQKFITRDGKTIAWDYGQVTAKTVALCRAPKRMIRQKISTFCQTLTPSRAILVWDQRAPIYRVVSALLANYDRTVQTRQRANEAKKVKDAMVRLERMQVQHDLLKSRGATSSRVPRPRMSKYASRIPGYKELYDKLLKSADEIEASTGKKPKVKIDDDLFEHDMEQKAALPPSDPMDDGGPRMPVHNTLPVALPPPMQEALGVIRYGKKFPPGTNDLTIELYAFRHQLMPEQGGLGPFQHFKNAVDLLWNRKGSTRRFIWSPWAEEMIREACDNQYLGVAGCASCVSGETRMLDPVTGEEPTIRELCEQKRRPTVMTLNGPVVADVPYRKGRAPLFRFRLTSGAHFDCTAEHRLLTPSGWVFARDTSVGSLLLGYVPCRPGSTAGSAPEAQTPSAHRYSRTAGDSRLSCSVYLRPDDVLLPQARAAARDTPPSPTCVQRCSACVCAHSGALYSGQGYTRLCQQAVLSTHSDASPFLLSKIHESPLAYGGISLPPVQQFRQPEPFQPANNLPHSYEAEHLHFLPIHA